MKFNKYLAILVVFLLFNSCEREAPMWERTYRIKNNSGFDVTIRAFESFTGIGLYEDITLLDNQVYTGDKIRGSNFDALENIDSTRPASSLNSSMLIVVFNNDRKITHSFDLVDGVTIFTDPINRHLLRAGNYTNLVNDIYEFVLTQEDFNNAIPCDGDCLD